MQAPVYPPAAVYVKPTPAPFVFGVDTLSVAEAVADPAIKALIVKAAPQMDLILRASQVQTHISNWSIRSLVTLTLITPEQLADIEAGLAALPVSERPSL